MASVAIVGAIHITATPSSGQAPQCDAPIATYRVRPDGDDGFLVDARFAGPTERFDLAFFPTLDRPQGQAEYIQDLLAFDEMHEHVDIEYVGEGGWKTPDDAGASALRYRVLATHDETEWVGPGKDEVATRFDETYFFVGHAFFLVDFQWPTCEIEISFDLPSDWIATTPWRSRGDILIADDPEDLARNAFAMGRNPPGRVELNKLGLTWIIDSQVATAEPRIVKIMETLPSVFRDYFDAAPVAEYTAFFFADPETDGGAFRRSFALRLAFPLLPLEEVVWSHTLGHEILHLWIGAGRIHGENPSDTYWFTEGFTDYLTMRLMRQAGLIDQDLYEARLANVIRRYRLGQRFSPDVSLVEAGMQKFANWELIYGGGALVAFLLEAELSVDEPGAFREMMRAVYQDGEKPYSMERLTTVMNANTGGRAEEVLAWVEEGQSMVSIRDCFSKLGIETAGFTDEVYVRKSDVCQAACAAIFADPHPQGDKTR